MAVLDSDVIIDYLRGKPGAIGTIDDLLLKGSKIKTTAFNYYEVYFGTIAFESIQKQLETQVFLETLDILFPTIYSLKKSAEIRLALRKKGKTISPMDSLIAGIVLAESETIYTSNMRDFSQIAGLSVKPCGL